MCVRHTKAQKPKPGAETQEAHQSPTSERPRPRLESACVFIFLALVASSHIHKSRRFESTEHANGGNLVNILYLIYRAYSRRAQEFDAGMASGDCMGDSTSETRNNRTEEYTGFSPQFISPRSSPVLPS